MKPLCVIPLHDGKVQVGDGQLTVPLSGFSYRPDRSRRYGNTGI
jgi:hypothetical protein